MLLHVFEVLVATNLGEGANINTFNEPRTYVVVVVVFFSLYKKREIIGVLITPRLLEPYS